jgi:hypothetical protein
MAEQSFQPQPSETLIADGSPPSQSNDQTFLSQSLQSTQQHHLPVVLEENSKKQEEPTIQPHLSSEGQPEPQTEPPQKPAIDTPTLGMFLTSISPRGIFTDGLNSFWHFVIGMLAVKYPIFVSLFIFYQILDRHDINICIDILEFILGFTITYFFLKIQ